jgi:hypothetical protein
MATPGLAAPDHAHPPAADQSVMRWLRSRGTGYLAPAGVNDVPGLASSIEDVYICVKSLPGRP